MVLTTTGKYSQLIDPTIQEVHLSPDNASDLLECLDYSRMSATPRRKSEPSSTSQLATLSQLPSPFFDEFINLLPFNYSRPVNTLSGTEDIFGNQDLFDSTNVFLPTSVSMPIYSSVPLQAHVSDPIGPIITSPMPSQNISMAARDIPQNPTANSASSFSPTSSQSYGISPGRRESFSHLPNTTSRGIDFMPMPQRGDINARRLASPSVSMKRPWYETST